MNATRSSSLSLSLTVIALSSSIAAGSALADDNGDEGGNGASSTTNGNGNGNASTPKEIGGHWNADSYTIEVVPNEDVIDTAELMKAAENAAEAWNQTSLGPQIVVMPATKGVAGGFAYDHHNTLSIVDGAWPANHQFAGLTQRALEGDVIVETDSIINASDWQFCDGDDAHKIDLQSVLTHELGHTLGLLDDRDHEQATMYYGSKADDTTKRSLSPLDVSALEKQYAGVTLYSTHPAAAGCSSTSTGTFAPAFVFLGGLLLRARRRHARR